MQDQAMSYEMTETKRSDFTIVLLILSDAVCPWCFVAKRKLELAMKAYPHMHFVVEWLPFFLAEPDLPSTTEGQSDTVTSRLCRRYGEERGKLMVQALQKAGESVSITWSQRRVPASTALSHCLVKFATKYNKQNEVMDSLFSHYFEREQDISNIDTLVRIATDVGLDELETRQYLENPEIVPDIKREAEELRQRYKVSGVPTFMISRSDKRGYKLTFSGAQPVEVFTAAINRIIELQ